jgi:glycosyltransferase involved in cell wall biosynthesis
VIGIALRNGCATVRRALQSALAQEEVGMPVGALILDDGSTDGWEDAVADLLPRPRVAVARARHGAAWRVRNALMALAERLCPRLRWHARLDADDLFRGPHALRDLVAGADRPDVVAVLAGNRQRLAGRLLRWPNRAVARLLDRRYLLARLEGMARLEPRAELPSCNLLLRAHAGLRYPAEESAEDHWLVARLLLQHHGRVRVTPRLLCCEYTLAGAVTRGNRQAQVYRDSRRRLLVAARGWL